MTNPKETYANREPITEKELAEMLEKTEEIAGQYYRLRVRALISLLKKFGKRRREISTLRVSDMVIKEGYLFVTFSIAKKHKKGFFQYLKEQKNKGDPALLNKPYPELVANWKTWQETEQGYRSKNAITTKSITQRQICQVDSGILRVC
jgi:hypothetical protein